MIKISILIISYAKTSKRYPENKAECNLVILPNCLLKVTRYLIARKVNWLQTLEIVSIDSKCLHSFISDPIVWKPNFFQTLELVSIDSQRRHSLIRDLIVAKGNFFQTLELVSIGSQHHRSLICDLAVSKPKRNEILKEINLIKELSELLFGNAMNVFSEINGEISFCRFCCLQFSIVIDYDWRLIEVLGLILIQFCFIDFPINFFFFFWLWMMLNSF